MSLEPVQRLAALAGTNRETVKKRADQLGLVPVPGEKGATLYDSRLLLQLIPPPSRSVGESEGATLEESRIRQTLADARVKELTAAKLEGSLVDVNEVLEAQNSALDIVAAEIKKSGLTDNEKEDILGAVTQKLQAFWGKS